MIAFAAVWWLLPVAAIAFIFLSYFLTRLGKLESRLVRDVFVGSGAFFGFFAFALPFFRQPYFHNPVANYVIGLPLVVLGLVGRVYPMLYLRKKGTTTTLEEVGELVDSGPYSWVRHPQYTSGMVMLIGWFLVWGALYALALIPVIGGIIYVQALIEEKYILEKKFGREYEEYRERVGMLIPHKFWPEIMYLTI